MTSPREPHLPLRTCIGCRRRLPQATLVRCVLDASGFAQVDRLAPGRGAWLCGVDCLDPALKRRGFDRAWRAEVRPGQLEHLRAQLAATGKSGARLTKTKG